MYRGSLTEAVVSLPGIGHDNTNLFAGYADCPAHGSRPVGWAVGIPANGNGLLASAAGMDREFTKKLLVSNGLAVPPGVATRTVPETLDLELPVLVRPARAGSSIGTTRVNRWEDLPAAIAKAQSADPKVLIEQVVPGRRITVGVLERPDGTVEAGPLLESELDPLTTRRLQEAAVRVFHTLGCRGLVRVDFFLTAEGTAVVNEVDTFPGYGKWQDWVTQPCSTR